MKKKYLKYILHAAVLISLIIAAIKYLNGEALVGAFESFDYSYAPVILALSTVHLLLKAGQFLVLFTPINEEGWRKAVLVKAYLSGQAAVLVPGGVAARAGLLRQIGVPLSKSTGPLAFVSLTDHLVFVTSVVIAALVVGRWRGPAFAALGVLVAIALVFIIPASRQALVGLLDRLMRRLNSTEEWENFQSCLPYIFNWPVMSRVLGLSAVGLLIKVTMFYLAVRGSGIEIGIAMLFVVYVIPTLLGRFSGLPGGVGVAEASMGTFLSSLSNVSLSVATAASFLFRLAEVFYPSLLGALVYFFIWDGEEEVAPEMLAHLPDQEQKSPTLPDRPLPSGQKSKLSRH